jgi:DNA-binding response OmpR family regulator
LIISRLKKSLLCPVEDEVNLCVTLKSMFEDEGYEVDTAEDGKMAIDLMRRNHYDLITMCLLIPRMNGVEVLREMKNLPQVPKVIMVTACDNVKTAMECVSLGVIDYITKPFDPGNLTEIVRRALTS